MRHDTRYRFGYTSLVTPVVDRTTWRSRPASPIAESSSLCSAASTRTAYTQYREWATAPDGTRVPISMVARKDVAAGRQGPVLLYGYGAYEISMDP